MKHASALNTLRFVFLSLIALLILFSCGFFADFVELLPFGGPILGVLLKVFQVESGSSAIVHNLTLSPFAWSVNEVLDAILIAVMSSALGYWFGHHLVYAEYKPIRQKLQYFICDFAATMSSCFLSTGLCSALSKKAFHIPVVLTQIILIMIFTLIDIVVFARDRNGTFNKLSFRLFFVDILKSVLQMFLMITIVLSIYVITLSPSTMYGLISIIIIATGISYIVSIL